MDTLGTLLLKTVGSILALILCFILPFEAVVLVAGIPPLWAVGLVGVVAVALWVWFLRFSGWIGGRPAGFRVPVQLGGEPGPAGPRGPRVGPLVWLAVGALLMTWVAGLYWNARMNRLSDTLKRDGYPTTVADFARDVPASRNAGPAMEAWAIRFGRTLPGESTEALARMSREVSDAINAVDGEGLLMVNRKEDDRRRAWGPGSAAVLAKTASAWSARFRMIETGLVPILAKYDLRVALDYKAEDAKVSPDLPHCGDFVNACRVLSILARRRAMNGDLAGAWNLVEKQVKLADLVGQDPYLIDKMIALADAGIAARTASAILGNRRDAVIPPALARSLAAMTAAQWLQAGMAAEIASNLHSRDALRNASPWKPLPGYEMSRREVIALKKISFTGILDAKWHPTIVKIMLPAARARKWADDPYIKDVPPYPAWIESISPWMSAPRFAQLFQKQIETQSRIRFALIASAIHSFRNRTGKLPGHLGELVKKDIDAGLLADPFTDKQYGYAVTKTGFDLTSPGPWGWGEDSKGQAMRYGEPLPPAKPAPKRPTR